MPFPFPLPTTSPTSFLPIFHSPTHSSLPLAATTQRNLLGELLKRHKHLSFSPASQAAHLQHILSTLEAYISHLFALDSGLSHHSSSSSSDNILVKPCRTLEDVELLMITEWRPVISSYKTKNTTIPGRRRIPSRVKLHGLQNEIAMALATLGYTHSILARQYISSTSYLRSTTTTTTLTSSSSLSPEEQRTRGFQIATKHFLFSAGIHQYIASSSLSHRHPHNPPNNNQQSNTAVELLDLSIPVQTALSELSLAEATLLAVSKDDPYALAVAKEFDPTNKEWMIKAPDLPKVRAHLFARLCVAAGEHLQRGIALLNTAGTSTISIPATSSSSSAAMGAATRKGDGGGGGSKSSNAVTGKINTKLVRYMESLRRTARAKACRFLAIDVELSGEVGKGIGWLKAGQMELLSSSASSSSVYDGVDETTRKMAGLTTDGGTTTTKLKKWKSEWSERRSDRKMEKKAASMRATGPGTEEGRRTSKKNKDDHDDDDDDGRIEEGRVIRYLLTRWERANDTIHAQLIPHPTILLPTIPSGRNIHSIPSYTPPQLDDDVLRGLQGPVSMGGSSSTALENHELGRRSASSSPSLSSFDDAETFVEDGSGAGYQNDHDVDNNGDYYFEESELGERERESDWSIHQRTISRV